MQLMRHKLGRSREHKTNLKAPKQADSRLIKPGQKMAKSIGENGKIGSKPQRQRSQAAAFVMDMTTKCQAVKTNEAKPNAEVWAWLMQCL